LNRALLFTCVALLGQTSPLHAADGSKGSATRSHRISKVAVLPLVAQGVDSSASQIVTDALSSELINTGSIRVMERSQLNSILTEQGFQQSGACDGNECAVQIGKLLSVDAMVVGSLGKLGESFTINVRVIDIATGEVVGSSRQMQRGAIDKVVADALPKVSSELAEAMGSRMGGEPKKGSTWGYWVAGGVAVTGGVIAALLLSKDGAAPPATETPDKGDASWKTTVTWP
jgi:TolB-like protein